MSRKHRSTAIYNADNAPVVFADEVVEQTEKTTEPSTVVEDNSVISEASTSNDINVQEKPTAKEEIDQIPSSFFTNIVRMRIVGRHRCQGTRYMNLVGIANCVVENNASEYQVVTSEKTAKSVALIIRKHSEALDVKDISDDRKELLIRKFFADCKRYNYKL